MQDCQYFVDPSCLVCCSVCNFSICLFALCLFLAQFCWDFSKLCCLYRCLEITGGQIDFDVRKEKWKKTTFKEVNKQSCRLKISWSRNHIKTGSCSEFCRKKSSIICMTDPQPLTVMFACKVCLFDVLRKRRHR